MASNVIGPTMLPSPQQVWFEQTLLAIEMPNLIHGIAAMRKVLPNKVGRTWRARRYDLLPPSITPLDDDLGVEVPPTPTSKVDVDATLKTYGQYVKITETVTYSNSDPVLNEHVKLLGQAMRLSEDILIREMLSTTATLINATGGTNGDNPTNMMYSDIQKITRTMLGNNATTIGQNIEAQNKFGTAPQRNSYFAFCHTDLSSNIESLANFTHKSSYSDQRNIANSEWGQAGNIRFFLSTEGKIVPNSSGIFGRDVYEVYIPGMESYAVIEQNEFTNDLIYHSAKYADALEQYCTLAYKMRQAPVLLNDAWIAKFRCTLLS